MPCAATTAVERIISLDCWQDRVEPVPITGGITNLNFTVVDAGQKFFVRVGEDIPVHMIMRFNELAASRAAFAAGISPEVIHAASGMLVLKFIEAKTLSEADVRDEATLPGIVALIRRCHRDVPQHWRGPALYFSVFHVLRDYAATLKENASRHAGDLPRYRGLADELEKAVGPTRIVFGHNDLLPTNFMHDGHRLWLIDYDYAGFTSPLFDLGGLAANNGLSPAQETWLLETYFETPVTEELTRQYRAMKCASLLRESMWSMVSEIHSELDVDYQAYTAENLSRFDAALAEFRCL